MASQGAERQVLARRWKYAAPPWRLFEALTQEREQWLQPWDGEATPALVSSRPNEAVVLAPWVSDEIVNVEVLVASDGGQGSVLTVVLHADHDLVVDQRRTIRYRLGTLFGEALRTWVDGW